RAADRWNNSIMKVKNCEMINSENYLHVYYEDLLINTEKVMMSICQFLNLDFEAGIVEIVRPTENLGDAKGHSSILSTNTSKFNNTLSKKQIRKIEQIVYEGASFHRYKLKNNIIKQRKLNRF